MSSMNALGDDMNQMGSDNLDDGSLNQMNDIGDQMDDDNGFDANVDADVETEPKKYIQQLTGKLSQELRKYNNEQEQPDEELNKYVVGMIIPQATKALTDKGKEDIIGKLKKSNISDEKTDVDIDDDTMLTESCVSRTDVIREILYNMINYDDNKNRKEKKITNKKISSTNPFKSNF